MMFSLSTRVARLPFPRTLATHASASSEQVTKITRHNWKRQEIQAIYNSPLLDLVFRAASIHRQNHDPKKIQLCTLMNIKSMSFTVLTPDQSWLNYPFAKLEDAARIVSYFSLFFEVWYLWF
jgi:hypothetical protein